MKDRFRGALLGLAAGDAVGTTVEFKPRGSFPRVTDMVGGGPFGLKPGQWTDDTSMALCLGQSLLDRQGFDPVDQLQKYVRWWREGYRRGLAGQPVVCRRVLDLPVSAGVAYGWLQARCPTGEAERRKVVKTLFCPRSALDSGRD